MNQDGDTDNEDTESEDTAEVEEEEVLPHEDEGDDEPAIRTVIVKADSGEIKSE